MITSTSKVSSKGQVVVPSDIRKYLGIEEGDDIKFIITDNGEKKFEVVKRESILELYGAMKPKKPITKDYAEIREEAQEEIAKRFEEKNK